MATLPFSISFLFYDGFYQSDCDFSPRLSLQIKATLREETASLRLSLEEEIDQFQLEEEKEEQGDPIIKTYVIHVRNICQHFM